ncbi:MAG: glycosyltransferase [Candidatus Omnitrophota bacterium]
MNILKKAQLSVGLPIYNGANFIRDAIDSLLVQQGVDFELIISDNGSTDRTPEICQEYVIRDKRVKYYRNELNRGPVWNFNNVFKLSSADYFMWAAHDDYWDPLYMKTCLEAFKQSSNVVLAGTACDNISAQTSQVIYTDEGLTTVGLKPIDRFKRYKEVLHNHKHVGGIFYGIYKRDALTTAMPLHNIITSDHLLPAQLSLLGEFVTSQERLMKKRWGGGSDSLKKAARVMRISNPFLVRPVYLVREIFFQIIIFTSDRLSFLDKMKLSFWSLGNYLWLCLKIGYWSVRDFIKPFLGMGNKKMAGQG